MKSQLNPIINYIMKFLTRLLIFTSFIFYSCNETSEVGIDELLINQKEKIKVHYVEIPLETSNIYFDSVRTDDGDLYLKTTGSQTISSHAGDMSTNDIVGIYVDMDASPPVFYVAKNGQ